MKVRIAIGLGASSLEVDAFAAVVARLRPLGFDSLWIAEVLSGEGFDPLVALAMAAGIDPSLKLGTTMLLPGRHELRLAKALASLDVLSRGRLLLTFVPGLTTGVERDAVGVPVAERSAAIERVVPRLRRWWVGEAVDGVVVRPVPAQQPLELWLGGLAPASLERCGRLADGWLGAVCTPRQAAAAKVAIDRAADAAGRSIDPEHFGLSIGYAHHALGDRELAALAKRNAGADPRTLIPVGHRALREHLTAFVDAGISKFVLRPPLEPGATAAVWLDELGELAAAVADLQT
jgi:probable F420-dependent oxidoreductase